MNPRKIVPKNFNREGVKMELLGERPQVMHHDRACSPGWMGLTTA